MPIEMFINLPVNDIGKSTEFFTRLGFSFDPQVGGPDTKRMIIGPENSALLHTEPFFRRFAGGDPFDPSKGREVVVGLTAESPAQVDALVDIAIAAGGESLGPAIDQGFMYMRAFRDLDGHQWSFLAMTSPRG